MSFVYFGSYLQVLELVCLSEVVQEVIGLLLLNWCSVEVEFFNFCDLVYWVEGDLQCLVQVLINLFFNVCDVSLLGGVIWVCSEVLEYIVDLVVEDEGSGILKVIMDQLFELFFIIKDFGKGIGFGFVLVYLIVEEYYGQIIIESLMDYQ